MRLPLPQIEPVAIMLDAVETTGDVRFSGVDLDSGARVRVTIERDQVAPSDTADPPRPGRSLVLVLTVETLEALQ